MDRLLLRPGEVAVLLGIGRSTAYQLIAQRVIPSVKIGKRIRVSPAALDDWIAKNAQRPRQPGAVRQSSRGRS